MKKKELKSLKGILSVFFLILLMFAQTSCARKEINQIKNGKFNQSDPNAAAIEGVKGTAYWSFFLNNANAALINENGVMKIGHISEAGTKNYAVQLVQSNLLVEQGKTYRVSFDARALHDRTISVKVGGLGELGWPDYTKGEKNGTIIRLSEKMTKHSFTFIMTEQTDSKARLEFQLGKNDSDVWIDNVRLDCLAGKAAVMLQEKDGTLQNGDFTHDFSNWITWADQSEQFGNGEIQLAVKNKELVVKTDRIGSVPFNPQVKQMGLIFETGQSYQVTFHGRADRARTIQVNVGRELSSAPWYIAYAEPQVFQLGEAMQPYTFSFVMTEMTPRDGMGKIVFELGRISAQDQAATVYLDQIKIEKLDKSPVRITKVSRYDLVKNGHFDLDIKNWDLSGSLNAAFQAQKLALTIDTADQENKISQAGLALEKNERYLISFSASSPTGSNLELSLTDDSGLLSYLPERQKKITVHNQKKVYQSVFTMAEKSDNNARITFKPLNSPGQIMLDHISVKKIFTYMDPTKTVRERVENLLSMMTLEEKIGQMVQAERTAVQPGDISQYRIGSILSGGGSAPAPNQVQAWIDMYNRFQAEAMSTRLEIPLIYGADAVHGHTNVSGSTGFPHNIGLGATRNPRLIQKVARVIAREVAATGLDWSFSPCVSVARDERWGRTYESFGEDPLLQELFIQNFMLGFQGHPSAVDYMKGEHIVSCVKHFLGDGGTQWLTGEGSYSIDRGDITELSLEELKSIHARGYIEAINNGALTVMASFNMYKGRHMHAYKELLTDYLKASPAKGGLGFQGFVVGDWDGISLISEVEGGFKNKVIAAFNAGLDMSMEQSAWLEVIRILKEAVDNGDISLARIDDAVKRILKVKFLAGLFEQPYADYEGLNLLGSKEHRQVAQQAVRQSLVLLKNKNSVLPLKPGSKIFVSGPCADNVGFQNGGWTIAWQGGSDSEKGRYIEGTSILEGIRSKAKQYDCTVVTDLAAAAAADVSIVVVGEIPYAEGVGDMAEEGTFELDDTKSKAAPGNFKALENAFSLGKPVIVIMVAGRPRIITDEIDKWHAFVMAWLPGTEGGAIADVLFGEYNFTGKLPVTWPRSLEQLPINIGDPGYGRGEKIPLFEYGYGLKMN